MIKNTYELKRKTKEKSMLMSTRESKSSIFEIVIIVLYLMSYVRVDVTYKSKRKYKISP